MRRRGTGLLMMALIGLMGLMTLMAGCGPDDAPPVPPGHFAFGVFGDGPYYRWEQGRFGRVLDDVRAADLAFFLHVGDLLWYPCSDEAYATLRARLDALPLPVIYTPGDNEWTDCHEERPGGYVPLERLARLRRTFFATPGRSLGTPPLPLRPQSADSAFADFPENARWTHGGFVFATFHLVGSDNATQVFPGRTADDDAAHARRTEAALAWLDAAFATARADSAHGVVLILHANLGIDPGEERPGYDGFVARLKAHVGAYGGPVLLIHGDSHTLRFDHPLRDADGQPFAHFTRLETYGSPEIGWVRVVVDSVGGRIVGHEARLMRGFW